MLLFLVLDLFRGHLWGLLRTFIVLLEIHVRWAFIPRGWGNFVWYWGALNLRVHFHLPLEPFLVDGFLFIVMVVTGSSIPNTRSSSFSSRQHWLLLG